MTVTWSEVIGFSPTGTRQLPDEDGVYAIAKMNSYGILEVRYIGQGNIRNQMDLHLSSSEPNPCLKTVMSDTSNVKIRFAIIKDATERNNAEYTYYNYYLQKMQPLCNDISPPISKWINIPLPF